MSSRFGSRPSGVTLAMLGLMVILSRPISAQPGTAPNGDPGGFGIDGDLGSNSPTAGTSDWASEAGGTGVALLFNNGTPATSFTVHGVDEYNNSDLIFIGPGSRLMENPNTSWSWDTPGTMDELGGKENLNNGLAHFSRDAAAHTWVTWAMDRRGGGGQSYYNLALYQNSLVRNGNGTFSSTGPHGGHTVGDLILALELLDSMSLPALTVWRWTEVSPGVYAFTSLTPAAGTKFTAANVGVQVPVPWGAYGHGSYSPETFAEASIDLTALLASIQPGATFRTLFFTSRFGPMIESQLRDFMDPISLTIPTDAPFAEPSREMGIVAVTPNPAHGPVTVEFDLGEEGPVTLEVYDLAGRRVAAMDGGVLPAGRHTLRWNPAGSVRRGHGGVFHAQLAGGTRTDGRRFVILP